jgi:hypothetical protein
MSIPCGIAFWGVAVEEESVGFRARVRELEAKS